MKLTEKLEQFDKEHNEAKDAIVGMLNSEHEWDKDFTKIANWLMTNDHSPYAYLEDKWAPAMYTSSGMASLLHNLHHAMVDDGDVSFIRVELNSGVIEYQIKFACFWDLTETPTLLGKSGGDVSRYVGAKLTKYTDPMLWVKDYEFNEAERSRRFAEFDERMADLRNRRK